MESSVREHSCILIPFPPNPRVIEDIKILIEKWTTKCMPDPRIMKTEIFEGLYFSWRSWYEFNLKDTFDWVLFKSRLEEIYEKNNEEMLVIDWIGENDYEYIDLRDDKQYYEVFSECYLNGNGRVDLYSSFLRLVVGDMMSDVGYNQLEFYKDLMENESMKPIFRKLWRRGLIDIPEY